MTIPAATKDIVLIGSGTSRRGSGSGSRAMTTRLTARTIQTASKVARRPKKPPRHLTRPPRSTNGHRLNSTLHPTRTISHTIPEYSACLVFFLPVHRVWRLSSLVNQHGTPPWSEQAHPTARPKFGQAAILTHIDAADLLSKCLAKFDALKRCTGLCHVHGSGRLCSIALYVDAHAGAQGHLYVLVRAAD